MRGLQFSQIAFCFLGLSWRKKTYSQIVRRKTPVSLVCIGSGPVRPGATQERSFKCYFVVGGDFNVHVLVVVVISHNRTFTVLKYRQVGTHRHKHRRTHTDTDTDTNRHTYTDTDRHTDTHTHTHRQTDRQTDTHTHTHIHTSTCTHTAVLLPGFAGFLASVQENKRGVSHARLHIERERERERDQPLG